jgi:hypothetical protein
MGYEVPFSGGVRFYKTQDADGGPTEEKSVRVQMKVPFSQMSKLGCWHQDPRTEGEAYEHDNLGPPRREE